MLDRESPPGPEGSTSFALVMVLFGILVLIISRQTGWKEYGETIGFLILGIGVPYLLWRLYLNMGRLHIVSLLLFMRKEKLRDISKGAVKNRKLIANRFQDWAEKKQDSTIKIKGVTLNLFFGAHGLLHDLLDSSNKLVNPGGKTIRILLLNPYSMTAITRSIQESRPFDHDDTLPIEAICRQTLKKHKSDVLYRDFCTTIENIQRIQNSTGKNNLNLECRIYSNIAPGFLLVDDHGAISENLILGRKKTDPAGKLYGLLPHMVYDNGDIKECLENHFENIWQYDSIPLKDFHESVEEKNYEVNRLFLLYNLQKNIWDRQWENAKRSALGRSLQSIHDELYEVYKKELFIGFEPRRILDLGCGDGGGGSLKILADYPTTWTDFVDISEVAIELFQRNAKANELDDTIAKWHASDMLTFLNSCKSDSYALVYANFSIIYMTKIKAVEIFRQIFRSLQSGGVFMISLWTEAYFQMPVGRHGEKGFRPPYLFERIPMTENLQVMVDGPEVRLGEIRRFYKDFKELMEEFESADDQHVMDLENITLREYECGAVLRVWMKKK